MEKLEGPLTAVAVALQSLVEGVVVVVDANVRHDELVHGVVKVPAEELLSVGASLETIP